MAAVRRSRERIAALEDDLSDCKAMIAHLRNQVGRLVSERAWLRFGHRRVVPGAFPPEWTVPTEARPLDVEADDGRFFKMAAARRVIDDWDIAHKEGGRP